MLRQTLDRLASDFATEVFLALRTASLDELSAIAKPSPARPRVARSAAAALSPAPASPPKARTRALKKAAEPTPAAPPDRELTRAAVEFFAERGTRGATASQLQEHLQAGSAVAVITALAARGIVRDAGIRRATGKGTAPVFVLST